MATKKLRADAPDVAQVDTLTPGGTIEVGDKFNVLCNGKTVPYTAVGTTVASVTAGVAAALAAATIPEFEEITFADATTTVTATSNTAGVPFTLTVTTTESDGSGADAQTFVRAASTANSGHWNWDVAANWDASGVPASSDNVTLENSDADILYGLAQSAVALTSLTFAASFTGTVGLPAENANGYYEYRATYLAIGSATTRVGEGEGNGSGRIKLDNGTEQGSLTVMGTASPLEPSVPAFLWKGTHASNALNVFKGSVGIAFFAGETATLATLRVGFVSNILGDADVVCGAGLTLATIEQSGGKLTLLNNFTTLNKTDGETIVRRAATATTLTLGGGTTYWESSGTITTATVGPGATLDFSRDMRARTVTNCTVYAGATIRDPHKTVTWSNGIIFGPGVSLADVTLELGDARTLTPS